MSEQTPIARERWELTAIDLERGCEKEPADEQTLQRGPLERVGVLLDAGRRRLSHLGPGELGGTRAERAETSGRARGGQVRGSRCTEQTRDSSLHAQSRKGRKLVQVQLDGLQSRLQNLVGAIITLSTLLRQLHYWREYIRAPDSLQVLHRRAVKRMRIDACELQKKKTGQETGGPRIPFHPIQPDNPSKFCRSKEKENQVS